MDNFKLDTFERLQRNWDLLSVDEITQLEAQGTITTQIEHFTNLAGRGDQYSGQVQARSVWVHAATGTVLGERTGWATVDVDPQHVFAALATGINLSSAAQGLLARANGGTMPKILPPQDGNVEEEEK